MVKKKCCKTYGKGVYLTPYQGKGVGKKSGMGVYLKPYQGKGFGKKSGKGVYLKPYQGKGIFNSLISHIPFPLHIPTYKYCGPNTNIKENIAKNIQPKNKLDSYCKEHDIFYLNNPDTAARNRADLKLADQAWSRVKSSDASLGEKAVAYAVTNLMKAKAKLGLGLKFRNKKYEQFPAVKGSTRRASLSRRIFKKPTKRSKAKKK